MSTTTAPTPSTTTSRQARIAVTGAALWVLFPVAWTVAELETQEFGTLPFVAVAASYWICGVLPPALLVAGYLALRGALGERLGRFGAAGVVVACTGLVGMTLGNGIEVASISAGGGEVALGHTIFLIGFLLSITGGVLTGITVIRRRQDGRARAAGWLLVVALPLGMGISLLGSVIAPGNDAAFWAGIAIPTGVAWLLLAPALATRSGAEAPAAVATA
jgi:hypothetical protein